MHERLYHELAAHQYRGNDITHQGIAGQHHQVQQKRGYPHFHLHHLLSNKFLIDHQHNLKREFPNLLHLLLLVLLRDL